MVEGSYESVEDGAAKSVAGIRSRVTVREGVEHDCGIRLRSTGMAPTCVSGMVAGGGGARRCYGIRTAGRLLMVLPSFEGSEHDLVSAAFEKKSMQMVSADVV